MTYLLDTNVLSEIIKKRPNRGVVGRLDGCDPGALFASVVSVTELKFGAERHASGERLWKRIATEILSRVKLVPIGASVALEAGIVMAEVEAKGKPIGIADVYIGATARVHDLVVVTRNTKHLSQVARVTVESWWSD